MRKPAVFAALVVLGLAADLLSKWYVFRLLDTTPSCTLIPGVLQFIHAENTGVAFSLLDGRRWLIVTVTSLAVCFLVWLYVRLRTAGHALTLFAIALLVIGAAGNLADRIAFAYVRDFIDFMPTLPFIGHWAIFNVADVCITVGVGLFLIAEMFLTPAGKPAEIQQQV
jgi:signal peptidase II